MITKYINFINENWQLEVKQKSIDISNKILDKEEIVDVFLELTENNGFEIRIIDGIYGYIRDNKFEMAGRKGDFSRYQCYPFYQVRLKKRFNETSTFDNAYKRLDYYKIIIDKVKIGISRLLNSKDDKIKILNTDVDYGKSVIDISFYIKMCERIPPFEATATYKPPKAIFDIILDFMNTNKLFTVIQFGVTGKVIEIQANKEYNDRELEPILDSMFKKFGDKVTYEPMDPSPKLGLKRYRININD
jgi:hypothetical protein